MLSHPDGDVTIGVIEQLAVRYRVDRTLEISFDVTAGENPTRISITSDPFFTSPVFNPAAFAVFDVTLTDTNGDGAIAGDGTFLPDFRPFLRYTASYKRSDDPTGCCYWPFTELSSGALGITAPPNGSTTARYRTPSLPGQRAIIPVEPWAVDGMQFQIWIDALSAHDSIRGTARFELSPEPGELWPGDFDGDGDVDLADYLELLSCFSGAGVPFPPGCETFDMDEDGDVDLSDVVSFQTFVTGGGRLFAPRPF